MGYSTQFLAQGVISTDRDPRVHENWDIIKTHRFGHFWLFSWAIAHCFWLWGRFQWLGTLGTRKLGRDKKHVDLVMSDHFRGL